MKIFSKITMLLFAALAFMMSSSCSKGTLQPQEQDYVTVRMGLSGEYIDISESPLATRAGEQKSDLIAVVVYSLSDNGNATQYAYGVFNSLDDVYVKLLTGQKYKFVASIMIDGYKCEEHNNTCLGFGGNVSKHFTYSSNRSLYNYEAINCSNGHDTRYKHDRFYGELAEYVPTQEGIVKIETKRVSYGARFIAEDLINGVIKIEVGDLYDVELTADMPDSDGIYTFSDFAKAWRGLKVGDDEYVNYSESQKLTISWTKEDESVIPLGTYDVTFKRNIKTTIRIKVDDVGNPNGIVIEKLDDVFMHDDNEYYINGGEVVEVPITQE